MKIHTRTSAFKPFRAHFDDAGIDLGLPYDFEERILMPGERFLVDIGVAFDIPESHMGWVVGKSSTASKYGIEITHGVIDAGYTGFVKINGLNTGRRAVVLKPGMKLAQFILLPIALPTIEEVDSIELFSTNKSSRGDGGFGSTDTIKTKVN